MDHTNETYDRPETTDALAMTASPAPAPAQHFDEVEQLKHKYGKIYRIDLTLAPDDEEEIEVSYIFKRPSTVSYDRYVKTSSSGATKALKSFLFDNIAAEYTAKLEADLEEYPALTLSLGEKLLTMLGLSKNANLVKL